MPYSTQKARGLALAKNLAHHASALGFLSPAYHVSRADADDDYVIKDWLSYHADDRVMVRPAPNRPRHGFVESRAVAVADFTRLFPSIRREVLDAEPGAEIIFMPFIEADFNFIISSSGVTIGQGFDGATGGKNVVFVPAASDLKGHLAYVAGPYSRLDEAYGVGEGDDTYLEAVSRGHSTYLTQVRAGPFVAAHRDYIPQKTTVRRVVTVETDDLLEWERTAAGLKGCAGTVVYHPGGAVSSHFGVHCAVNKVPYVTTFSPEVGQVIKATVLSSWGEAEYARVAEYVRGYAGLDISDRRETTEALIVAIASLHAMSSLTGTRDDGALRLVAFALAFCPKVFTALAAGEARHTRHHVKEGFEDAAEAVLPWVSARPGRDSVYKRTLELPLDDMPDILARCHAIFTKAPWGDAYGGLKWGDCTAAAAPFLDDVLRFAHSGSESDFVAAISAFNVAVHKAHNNGWWLNKLLQKEVLDVLAGAPVLGLAKSLVWELLTRAVPTETLAKGPLTRELIPGYRETVAEGVQEAQLQLDEGAAEDNDDDEDAAEQAQSLPWGTPNVTEYPHHLHKAVTLHLSTSGHLQIPGDFGPHNNREWGVALDLNQDTATAEQLRELVRAGWQDQTPKVRSQHPGSDTQYAVLKVRVQGWRVLFNLLAGSTPATAPYRLSSQTLAFAAPLADVPELSILKELLR